MVSKVVGFGVTLSEASFVDGEESERERQGSLLLTTSNKARESVNDTSAGAWTGPGMCVVGEACVCESGIVECGRLRKVIYVS